MEGWLWVNDDDGVRGAAAMASPYRILSARPPLPLRSSSSPSTSNPITPPCLRLYLSHSVFPTFPPYLLLLTDSPQRPRNSGFSVAGGATVFLATCVLEALNVQANTVLVLVTVWVVFPEE